MCDWKALRAQLIRSEFLEPGDDINTQRGLVATAIAISGRMFDATPGTWTPARLRTAQAVPGWLTEAMEEPKKPPGPPSAKIVNPSPAPAGPRPGGIALQVPQTRALEELAIDNWF